MMGMCHCSRCRNVGASSLAFVKSDKFKISTGREKITTFKAEPPYEYDRCFCSVCGTSFGEVLSKMDYFPINANCIDTEFEIENKFHEFVSEKASWFKIAITQNNLMDIRTNNRNSAYKHLRFQDTFT